MPSTALLERSPPPAAAPVAPPMKTMLHVGCGPQRREHTTDHFRSEGWREIRLDIDPAVEPDIIGTMTDLSGVADGSVDAIFSSHNVEHLYPYEVPIAFAEFRRVLADDGYAVITCPDLQTVCRLVADDKLTDPAYNTAMGPITPLDILFGHNASLAAGRHYMGHRTGFTMRVLCDSLAAAGFGTVAAARRESHFDLWALATKTALPDDDLWSLARRNFPFAS